MSRTKEILEQLIQEEISIVEAEMLLSQPKQSSFTLVTDINGNVVYVPANASK